MKAHLLVNAAICIPDIHAFAVNALQLRRIVFVQSTFILPVEFVIRHFPNRKTSVTALDRATLYPLRYLLGGHGIVFLPAYIAIGESPVTLSVASITNRIGGNTYVNVEPCRFHRIIHSVFLHLPRVRKPVDEIVRNSFSRIIVSLVAVHRRVVPLVRVNVP